MKRPNEPDIENDSPRDYKRKVKYMELKGYVYRKCTACNGSGYYDNHIRGRIPKCSSCHGTGMAWEKDYKES